MNSAQGIWLLGQAFLPVQSSWDFLLFPSCPPALVPDSRQHAVAKLSCIRTVIHCHAWLSTRLVLLRPSLSLCNVPLPIYASLNVFL